MANNISTLDEISQLQLDERLKIRACGIGNLPTEILALIFSMVHSQSLSSSTTKFTTSDAVLRLSHVNSIWRETCISFSRLWSHIHIICASRNEAERIQLFLERSGTSSLTIDFYAPEGVDLYHPEIIGVIQKLFDACGRWKEASFSAEAQSLEQVAMILSGDNNLPQLAQRFNFPLLEKLAFIHPLGSQNRPFLDIFQQKSTPKLRTLVIPSYTTFLPFAFDQITSLQLLKTNSVLLPRICTQLVELEIGQTFGEFSELIPSAVAFEMPKVETLTVTFSGSGRLWNMLTLPSLRNFILEAITFMPLEYIAVLNMLRRSGCGPSLRRLNLAGMDAQAVDVESMLILMPQLEELVLKETLMRQQRILTPRLLTTLRLPNSQYLSVIDTSAISPATPSEYKSTSSRSRIIPDLVRIELHIYYFPKFRLDLLFDMLLSRIVISDGSSLSAVKGHSTSGALKSVRLCFIMQKSDPPDQVPVELENMVNRLRLASTSQIHSTVRCEQVWRKEI